MIKIMFVCTGNICRSAMAHQYMQKKVKDLNIEEKFLISSCGTYAATGDKSTQNAIQAMLKYQVDLLKHRAINIYDIDICEYDIILCMTQQHKQNIENILPKLKDKIYTLKEYVNDNEKYINIDDPWGLDLKIYSDCADDIVKCVDKLIQKLEGCEKI